jgi:hypothetical protein
MMTALKITAGDEQLLADLDDLDQLGRVGVEVNALRHDVEFAVFDRSIDAHRDATAVGDLGSGRPVGQSLVAGTEERDRLVRRCDLFDGSCCAERRVPVLVTNGRSGVRADVQVRQGVLIVAW